MDIKQISLQVYTARHFKPYKDILKFLSEQGMNKVELFEVEAFSETKDILDKYNMNSPSTHIGFSTLENIDLIISNLTKSNITNAIVPSPVGKPGGKFSSLFDKTEEEWNEFGKSLSSYVKIFQDNGINLGYHNHSFEFNPLPSGKMPIECILDHNEDLKFEIDLGWTVAGNADPIFWIKKYAYKIIACHLKDFTSKELDLINHDSQCAIGDGFIDWKEVLTEVKKTNCNIFALEHDNPTDYKDYVTKSLQFLNSLEL
jgi:sugar phosphate isomerase/epimerase